MRSAAAYTEYLLTRPSVQLESKKDKNRKRSRSSEGKSSWWRVACERLAAVMVVGAVFQFIRRLFVLVIGLLRLSYRKAAEYQPVRYLNIPLSPLTETRINSVRRKIMVLDLDETLIHSHHDGSFNEFTPLTPPDFIVRVKIEMKPVRFFVHKRPHVDYFLSVVSQWYELVIFTASMEMYGMAVANRLENNRNIFQRRYFRQHCTMNFNGYTKDLSTVCQDMSSIFILDNSPAAYRDNPDNAIPVKSWFNDPHDTALLDLLPMLDALRFTNDVRSMLSRNLHLHNLW